MIACYCRVSTEDQSLERQLEATTEYAQEEFDVGLDEIEVYRDKSTGTDTERSGYKRMMEGVESGGIEAVVVNSVSRISRSIRDLDRTVELMREAGVSVAFLDESLTLDPESDDPMQQAMFRMMGVFAQLEADMIQQRTREGIATRQAEEDYHHGRPPLGFEKEDGHLIESGDYDKVAATIEMVQKDELSKRQAARELRTSRPTIDRALNRADLYGL